MANVVFSKHAHRTENSFPNSPTAQKSVSHLSELSVKPQSDALQFVNMKYQATVLRTTPHCNGLSHFLQFHGKKCASP
jgi:hypothetical protein